MERNGMTHLWRIAAAVAGLILGAGGALAERNYELLRSGTKALRDLSEAERRELAALEQLMRDGNAVDRRTPRQRCIDEEVAREGNKPSELAMRVIDKKCSQR